MDKDIIAKVKDFLQIQGEYDNVELVKRLTAIRNRTHPDRFNNEEEKKENEEIFKIVNNLLHEFKQTIKEQQSTSLVENNLPVEIKTQEDLSIELIETIGNLTDSNDRIRELENKVKDLEDQNKRYEQEIKNLEKQIQKKQDNQYEKESKDIASSLREIYKQTKANRFYSGASIISFVLTQIEEVKSILSKVFDNESIIILCIQLWFVSTIIYFIYKLILRIRITHYQNRLINPLHLKSELETHYGKVDYRCEFYFTEEDVVIYIKKSFARIDKLIFVFNNEEIVQQLTNHVILSINKKRLIKDISKEKLNIVFVLNVNRNIKGINEEF